MTTARDEAQELLRQNPELGKRNPVLRELAGIAQDIQKDVDSLGMGRRIANTVTPPGTADTGVARPPRAESGRGSAANSVSVKSVSPVAGSAAPVPAR